MAETAQTSDMGTGLGLVLGFVVALAAVATAATGWMYAIDHADSMKLFSGVALAIAFLAGGIAIAAIHIFE